MIKSAKHRSVEALLQRFILLSLALILLPVTAILYLLEASVLAVITVVLMVVLPYLWWAMSIRESIQTSLLGLSSSLEAIRNEDYALRTVVRFESGAMKGLSDEVNFMADDLRRRKLHYDQQAILVLNLIDKLATPIAVFTEDGRLNHGNEAFSNWCGMPWKQLKMRPAEHLGLIINDRELGTTWRIQQAEVAQRWQLRHSSFSMLGERYQLIVLTNIEREVNQAQWDAWDKMTRVLSHEINNSLAPIKSLAQSLADVLPQQTENSSARQALEVIVSRSSSLMQFVNRYASLNQRFSIEKQSLYLPDLLDKVIALFDHPISAIDTSLTITTDPILLEQILINLIKNAVEASGKQQSVEIRARQNAAVTEIKILDQGAGIANPDNLFVPFYTTKAQGKGIGLALSRTMLEQQGGSLRLENNRKGQGACATIKLN